MQKPRKSLLIVSTICVLDLVQAITPLHLDKLRALLNASAMDIMYYTSPLFGKEVSSWDAYGAN
jgi:hypothetical protein